MFFTTPSQLKVHACIHLVTSLNEYLSTYDIQWSLAFLAPETGLVEDNFLMGGGVGREWFQDD